MPIYRRFGIPCYYSNRGPFRPDGFQSAFSVRNRLHPMSLQGDSDGVGMNLPPDCYNPEFITTAEPKIFWIELTSKCPFECVFCSRKLLRGKGQDMPFDLYRSIIGQLDSPEIIRLNFAGESMLYPDLIHAVQLAKSKGAVVELVTALPAISENRMTGLIDSGLDLLSISIHSMDSSQYRRIFNAGHLENLLKRLRLFIKLREQMNRKTPVIDFSFVAMMRNLNQLPRVAALADDLKIDGINVHRVIRRDPIAETFSRELTDNRLNLVFKRMIEHTIKKTRKRFPDLRISCSNNALEEKTTVGTLPDFHAGELPKNARIASCIENPWETTHILCNGNVYPCGCGATPDQVMGNVKKTPLRDIWHGKTYTAFRFRYMLGSNASCRNCSWKIAYLPEPPASGIDISGSSQLLRGWFDSEQGNIIWSKPESVLALKTASGMNKFRLSGILPNAHAMDVNHLTVTCNHIPIGQIINPSNGFLDFSETFSIPCIQTDIAYFGFKTDDACQPFERGTGSDKRCLGFALMKAEILP